MVYDIVLPTLMSTLDDSSPRLFHWTTTIHKQCFIKQGLTLRIYHCVGKLWVYNGDILYIYILCEYSGDYFGGKMMEMI